MSAVRALGGLAGGGRLRQAHGAGHRRLAQQPHRAGRKCGAQRPRRSRRRSRSCAIRPPASTTGAPAASSCPATCAARSARASRGLPDEPGDLGVGAVQDRWRVPCPVTRLRPAVELTPQRVQVWRAGRAEQASAELTWGQAAGAPAEQSADRRAHDPVAAALVAEQVAPAARPRLTPVPRAGRDRPGAADHRDALGEARGRQDQRGVVHDEHVAGPGDRRQACPQEVIGFACGARARRSRADGVQRAVRTGQPGQQLVEDRGGPFPPDRRQAGAGSCRVATTTPSATSRTRVLVAPMSTPSTRLNRAAPPLLSWSVGLSPIQPSEQAQSNVNSVPPDRHGQHS